MVTICGKHYKRFSVFTDLLPKRVTSSVLFYAELSTGGANGDSEVQAEIAAE